MNDNLPQTKAGKLLNQLGLTLAVAESCTGGLVGHLLTNIPGSSAYFKGGVIAYAYESKVRILGVKQETLELHGAVSQETVLEMARGVRQLFQTDIGLSISGIAGPDGGSPEKPVGLTWIGLCAEDFDQAENFLWQGDRLQVKEQSASQALQMVNDYLRSQDRLKKAESVQVTCRFDPQGRIYPLHFTRQGSQSNVNSVGRQWEDSAGKHILVMDQSDQVYELLYINRTGKWLLYKPGKRIPAA
jgi:PncC family amidohydrolase